MRIDPNVVVSPTTLDTTKPGTPAKPAPSAGPDPAAASVVVLSSAASAVSPSSSSQAMISARIEKIRALLDRGEYPVDLEMLASRIVDDDIVRTGRSS